MWGHQKSVVKTERPEWWMPFISATWECTDIYAHTHTHTHTHKHRHTEMLFDMPANSHSMKPISPLSVIHGCLGNSPHSTVCVNSMNICVLMSLALAPHTLIKVRGYKWHTLVRLQTYFFQDRHSIKQSWRLQGQRLLRPFVGFGGNENDTKSWFLGFSLHFYSTQYTFFYFNAI